MSDKEDRAAAKKTLKTAKKGSAAHIEAQGILSGDDPEAREYRSSTRKSNNSPKKVNPYKDVDGSLGSLMQKFPETTMDIEDAVGFGKIYESGMKYRGKKSLNKIDEDYSGTPEKVKKSKGGKVSMGRGMGKALRGGGKVMR